MEAAIRDVEAAGRMLIDAAGVVIIGILTAPRFAFYNFVQAGRNLKNSQHVSEVRLLTAQMHFNFNSKLLPSR